MLIIRRAQMLALDRAIDHVLIDRLLRHFRYRRSGLVRDLSDDELRAWVVLGISRARGYGITWESNIARFVFRMLDIGPLFDQFPPVRQILLKPTIPDEEKMLVIGNTITRAQWAEARQFSATDWEYQEP